MFDLLRKSNAKAFDKCIPVPGDVSDENLGLSNHYKQVLAEEVEYIFHCAATTRFDDPLKTSIVINARGTHYMLELAKTCKNLKVTT